MKVSRYHVYQSDYSGKWHSCGVTVELRYPSALDKEHESREAAEAYCAKMNALLKRNSPDFPLGPRDDEYCTEKEWDEHQADVAAYFNELYDGLSDGEQREQELRQRDEELYENWKNEY